MAWTTAKTSVWTTTSNDGGIVPDPQNIITAGHDNKTARTVAFREGQAVNEQALSEMFKAIIANNRAGGWRKIKGSQ